MKRKLLMTLVLAVMLALEGNVWGQATLPLSFSGPWNSTSPTIGVTRSNTDTYNSNGEAKLSTTGHWIKLNVSGTPDKLSLWMKAYNAWGANDNHVRVYEATSDLGNTEGLWGTSIADFDNTFVTNTGVNSGDIQLSTTTTWVAIFYTKISQNVGIDNVSISALSGGNTPPAITNISHTPTLPNSSQTVSVSADITDSDGTIAGAELHWGTVSGSLSNSIDMSVSSGNTYTSDSNIPAQADGTTVYYEIYALDDDAGETTSSEQSYTVTNLASEPTNHVTGFTADAITTNSIPLSWTDSDADYYLIKGVVTGGTITPPVDGTAEADGLLIKNMAAGVESAVFSGLTTFTSYTFEIFPYNGTGTEINYLTSGTIPSVSASTLNTQASLPYTENFGSGLGMISYVNVSGSTRHWYWNTTSQCASVNGYNSGDLEEDWLILPSINLDNYTWEYLTFDSWYNYGTDDVDNYLKLMYATDYAGDPSTASWTELSFTAPSATSTWTFSGIIDLNSITGTDVVLAFKYHYNSGMYRSWSIDNISIQERVDVTFQVDMSEETVSSNGVHIAGNFSQAFWDPSGIEMTDPDTDGIYTVTLELLLNTEYQFKYINGNDWGSEETVPAGCIAESTTNRVMTTGSSDETLDVVCFGSCVSCNPPSYDVLFQVDLADETVTDGVFIAGTFNGWTPGATAMSLQSGSTTIYEVTLSLTEGDVIEYKFINGSASPQWETVSGSCVNIWGNRELTVPGENSTQQLVCFGACEACNPDYDITFQVNMVSETVSGDGVYLAGTFTNWGTNAIAMTNVGDIWYTTVPLMSGLEVQYKFVNGNPSSGGAWESFGGDCVNGSGNRFITIPDNTYAVDLVCFNSCSNCADDVNVIINEVDADTPGTDVAEFIELYDGGVGNTDLSDMVVVLYNGSDDLSYAAYDLEGYSTNADGYFVLGNSAVPNVNLIIPNGSIQNGADAVALYLGGLSDFPTGTPVTTLNLVDALVYDTDDSDDSGLLALLNPGQPQINENEGSSSADYSMQRLPNGIGGKRNTYTYRLNDPSPGTVNEVVITTFPYAQSFDLELFAPAGWTNVKTADPADPNGAPEIWDRQTSGVNPTCAPHSGSAMARYNCYSLHYGSKAELTTPPITFPDDGYKVSFWMYRDTNPWGITDFIDEGVNVYYNTTNSSSGGTLLGTIYREATQEPIVASDGWYLYSFNMPTGATGNNRYIVFEGFSSNALNIFIDDVTIEAFVTTTWTGTTDSDWATGSNWDNGVPNATTNVVIPAGLTNYPTLSASGECFNLTIESSATGSGSLLGQNYLTVNGTTTIERYATAGTWHGISGPLDNDDFNSLYFGGSPNVWAQTYLEASNTYDPVTSLSTDLGDAKGWMVWIGGTEAQTFEFTGDLRSGTVGPFNLNNSGSDSDHGYNFVGNPFPSAIDWEVIKPSTSNIGAGIWIWDYVGDPLDDNQNWATYTIGTGPTNGGSKDIALGQGFFVQVDPAGSGTFQISESAQLHSTASFMKDQATLPANLIKLKLTDGNRYDESFIRLDAYATEEFDFQLDLHKMFSWSEEQPQIYSTANNFMTVNVLPEGTVSVPMDVRGVDGNEMTISLEAVSDFDHVYLSDDFTGVQTELTEQPYTFTYDASQTDRFTVYFTIVSTEENALDNIRVYSFDKQVRLEIPMQVNVNVEVVNMLGQTVRNMDAHMGTTNIHLDHGGYYLVKITGDNQRVTRKVFIR